MNEKEAIKWLEDQEPCLFLSLMRDDNVFAKGKWKLETWRGTYWGNTIIEVVSKASQKVERS